MTDEKCRYVVPLFFLFKRFFMIEKLLKAVCGVRSLHREEPVTGSFVEEISSTFATFRSHVDDVVSVGDDI